MNDFDYETKPRGHWHVPSLRAGHIRGFLVGIVAGMILLALIQQF